MAASANTIGNLVRRRSRHLTPDCLAEYESGAQRAKAGTEQPGEEILVALILLHLEVGILELIDLIKNFFHRFCIGVSEENSAPNASELSAGVFFERHTFLQVIGVP